MHTIEHKTDEEKLMFVSILMQNISDAVIGTDTRENNYRILSWNKGAEKLYGWKAEEVIGKSAPDILRTNLDKDQLHLLQENLNKTGYWAGEVIQHNRQNDPINIMASVSIVRDDGGIEIGTVAVNRDMTHKKRAEEIALENKNKLLNEAEQIAQIGSWDWDLKTGQLNWSANMFAIYEIPSSANISFEQFNSCLHPDDRQMVIQRIQAAAEGQAFHDFYHRIICDSGTIKTLHARGEVIRDENGTVCRMMGTGQDVTERIRQSEELKKLSESDVQKNNFIAMASHELKTPITSIKGYVQLILEALEKQSEEKPISPLLLRSSLKSVDKQVSRLTRIISELLDLSKIERGALELKKETFSLNELAIETVEDILYTNATHEINLFHDYAATVVADKDRIGQVMINFLTNAIKYSPGSKKINVRVHKTEAGEAAFSVEDFGIGIDKEEQPRVFDRFYRANGKHEQTYPGFGIGLFIANEFITKHGGRLALESEKNKGSVFTFSLPIS